MHGARTRKDAYFINLRLCYHQYISKKIFSCKVKMIFEKRAGYDHIYLVSFNKMCSFHHDHNLPSTFLIFLTLLNHTIIANLMSITICNYFFIKLFSKRLFLKGAFKKAVGDSPTASINNGIFFRSAKSIYYFNVTIVRPFISPFKIFLQTSGNCSNVTSLAIDSNN